MTAATFSFNCQCGARLQARPDMAGKKGKCKHCGQLFTIPSPPASPQPAVPAAPSVGGQAPRPQPSAPVKEQVCSICQTPIAPGEPQTACDACHLPFHADCWQANFGCATYGCKNVNVLKPGPDIAIGHAAIQQAQIPPWQAQQQAARPAGSEIPWEYIFLGASVLCGLLSCVMCGIPSIILSLVAAFYVQNNPKSDLRVFAGVWIISVIAFFLGMISSFLMMIAG